MSVRGGSAVVRVCALQRAAAPAEEEGAAAADAISNDEAGNPLAVDVACRNTNRVSGQSDQLDPSRSRGDQSCPGRAPSATPRID